MSWSGVCDVVGWDGWMRKGRGRGGRRIEGAERGGILWV